MIERIKQYLRYNPFYIRYCKTAVNDLRYFVRDLRRYFSEYRFSGKKNVAGHTLYFILDRRMKHPGMVDRFKVIACLNHIAQLNGFDFKIVRSHDFPIEKYFISDINKWMAEESELSKCLLESRIFSYNGGKKRIPKLNRSVRQYHVYNFIGLDIIENSYDDRSWKSLWSESFNKIFQPSPTFESIIKDWTQGGFPEHGYVAVHLRFVNALEHFEDNFTNSLTPEQKIELVRSCLRSLHEIQSINAKLPVIVFSDSATFLSASKEEGFMIPPQKGHLGHISFDSSALERALFDFYLISRSSHAYSVRGGKLYTSEYPKYAALAGSVPFSIYTIDIGK